MILKVHPSHQKAKGQTDSFSEMESAQAVVTIPRGPLMVIHAALPVAA